MVTGAAPRANPGFLISHGRQRMRLLVDRHPHAVVHASRDPPVTTILCCSLHQQRQRRDHLFSILIITMGPGHESARRRHCHPSTKRTRLPPKEHSGRHPHQHDPDRQRLRRHANRDKHKPQQQTHAQGRRHESTRQPGPEPFTLRRHRRIHNQAGRPHPVTRHSVTNGTPARGTAARAPYGAHAAKRQITAVRQRIPNTYAPVYRAHPPHQTPRHRAAFSGRSR